MRTSICLAISNKSSDDSGLRVQTIKSSYWRNLFIRSDWNGAQYTLDVYGSKTDAESTVTRLAFATHGALDPWATVSLTKDPAAPFDITPAEVVAATRGTWDDMILGHVDDPELWLIDRIIALLELYRAPNESLDIVPGPIVKGPLRPSAQSPAIAVAPAISELNAERTSLQFRNDLAFDITAYSDLNDNPQCMDEVLRVAGALRSIALDEQRTWGGICEKTEARGPLLPAQLDFESRDGGHSLYTCTVPILATVATFDSAEDPSVAGGAGSGGKYAASL